MRFSTLNQMTQSRWLASGTVGKSQGCFVEKEIEIQELDIHAFRNGWACFCLVGKSN
jgi:hypothetical protein